MSQEGIIDIIGTHPEIPTSFVTDSGTAIPIANILEILGDASEGVSTSGSGNTVVIHVAGTPSWHVITASQTMAVDSGYICVSPGGALALLLPPVSALGDVLEVTLDGATSFSITQGAGQQIRIGNIATTAGVGGHINSTQQGDSLKMVCQVPNLKWNVLSSMGNPTVV